MSTIFSKQINVTEQSEALGLYLDELLQEQTEIDFQDESQTFLTQTTESEHTEEVVQAKVSNDHTKWAHQAFQTLFMEIDGIEIAIPMADMSGLIKYPDQLIKQVDSAPWIDGIFELDETKMQVVNARNFFLLSNNREIDPEEEFKKPEFIVKIGDGQWGLACHAADRAAMLEPDQVRWSGTEKRRPWLLGMIKKPLCMLLDGEELINYLKDGAGSV